MKNHVYAMMQRLGVSETEEAWSNPFWGGTTGLPPPPPPPPPPQPPQPPQPPAAQPSTQPTPSSEELHDCEANGNGKRGKPVKKSMPKKPSTQKRKPAHPKKNPKNSVKKKTTTTTTIKKKKTQEKKKPKAKSIRALAKGKSMGKPISLLGLIA